VTLNVDSNPTCTCPEYTQGLRICSAVCAVLFQLGRGQEHKDVGMLHPIWHIRNHPLAGIVLSDVPLKKFSSVLVEEEEQQQVGFMVCALFLSILKHMVCALFLSILKHMQLPTSLLPAELARIEHLKSLFHEVCLPSAQSPSHYITLRDKLVHQKQSLNGQSPSDTGLLILPPRSSITTSQSNSMRASAECVQNLSRMASSYNRNKSGRIQEAQRRDPTAYSLHKRGVEGAQIQCDCGSWLTNTKRARHYHSTCHKGHLSWLQSGSASCLATTSTAPDAAVHDVSYDIPERLQNDSHRAAEHHDGHDDGDTPVSPHTSAITDSVLDEMHALAPNDPTLPLGANLVRQAAALTDILMERSARAAESRWTKPPSSSDIVFLSRGPAWLGVHVKPADRLPRMTADGMTHFRVNQFCDLCREWQLCKTHEAMASNDNTDLTASHFSAMKATGHCLVECGGAGDCFYHSMLFLAKLYRNDLYIAWGDHDKFRKQSCDKLLVIYYHAYVYVFEYT
jgi:hypothetical protein